MFSFPKTEAQLKARISSYKSAMMKEEKSHGSISVRLIRGIASTRRAKVELISPSADIVVAPHQAAFCESVTVIPGELDE